MLVQSVFEYEGLEIPVKDLFEVAVALEEVKEGILERKAVNLSNGFRFGFWRGDTAVFWEYANYSAGIRFNNAPDPWYFPKVEAVIKLMLRSLKEHDFITRAGNLILAKKEDTFRVMMMGTDIKEEITDESTRIALATAMRLRAYYREGAWWVTSKMVTWHGKRVDQVHRVYLFLEVGI